MTRSRNPLLDPDYYFNGEEAPELEAEAAEPALTDEDRAALEALAAASGEGSGEGGDEPPANSTEASGGPAVVEPPSSDVADYAKPGGWYEVDGQRVKGKAAAQAIIDARQKAAE